MRWGGTTRLDSLQAAVLEVKLRYLPEWNRGGGNWRQHYDELFRAAGLAASTTTEGVVLPFTDPRADARLSSVCDSRAATG